MIMRIVGNSSFNYQVSFAYLIFNILDANRIVILIIIYKSKKLVIFKERLLGEWE